jgi:hypothetical protein
MSIEATYRRVSPERFAELEANQEAAYNFFHPFENPDWDAEEVVRRLEDEEANLTWFRLGKEWHALHFLLTGESELISPTRVPAPFGDVVQGGTPTRFDATYGPVRALSPGHLPQSPTRGLGGRWLGRPARATSSFGRVLHFRCGSRRYGVAFIRLIVGAESFLRFMGLPVSARYV